jgi:hypothetical protein
LAISVVLFDLGSTLYYFDGIPHEVFPRMDRALVNELVRFGYEIDPVEFIDEFVRLVKEADNLGEQSWIEIPTFDIVRTVLKEFGYPPGTDCLLRCLTGALEVGVGYCSDAPGFKTERLPPGDHLQCQ